MPVKLADIYNPLTFARRAQEAQVRKNRFLRSGIAVRDPQLAAQMAVGGNTGEINMYSGVTVTEPRYSTDDDTTVASTHAKITNKKQKWRSASRNHSWSVMDLARELADADPVGAITGRVGFFWGADDERRIVQSCLGILADNVANDAGDMVINVATDASTAVTDAERIGGERFLDALQTLGDSKEAITAMAIHSAIHTRLAKQGLIDYMRDADNNVLFERYMGKVLVVDDSLPAVAGSNRITYTCILFGPGAFLNADGSVENPFEIERKPGGGNGGGQDVMWSRVHNTWHPNGFDFNPAGNGVAGQSATYAELATATNWNRVAERKNIPLAFMQVND
jgi:hypothetical protein